MDKGGTWPLSGSVGLPLSITVDIRNREGYRYRMSTELEILARLNGRTFDQDDLTQIGLTSDTVINYERKTGLRLCSEQPGRGRSRKFCLMDVYLLRLTNEIVIMTGSVIAAVKAVDELLMYDFENYPDIKPDTEEDAQYRIAVSHDIFEAPVVFSYRPALGKLGPPYYLYTQAIKYGFFLSEPHERFDPLMDRSMVRRRLLFFNITQILTDIDDQLDRIIKEKYGVST